MCVCYNVWTAWDEVAEGGKRVWGLAHIFGETGVCVCGGKKQVCICVGKRDG